MIEQSKFRNMPEIKESVLKTNSNSVEDGDTDLHIPIYEDINLFDA